MSFLSAMNHLELCFLGFAMNSFEFGFELAMSYELLISHELD